MVQWGPQRCSVRIQLSQTLSLRVSTHILPLHFITYSLGFDVCELVNSLFNFLLSSFLLLFNEHQCVSLLSFNIFLHATEIFGNLAFDLRCIFLKDRKHGVHCVVSKDGWNRELLPHLMCSLTDPCRPEIQRNKIHLTLSCISCSEIWGMLKTMTTSWPVDSA